MVINPLLTHHVLRWGSGARRLGLPRGRRCAAPAERDDAFGHGAGAGAAMAVGQNLVPLVNIKIAGKWMFIPLKMVSIGIYPYPYIFIYKQ